MLALLHKNKHTKWHILLYTKKLLFVWRLYITRLETSQVEIPHTSSDRSAITNTLCINRERCIRNTKLSYLKVLVSNYASKGNVRAFSLLMQVL